jgi:hypothetical protein
LACLIGCAFYPVNPLVYAASWKVDADVGCVSIEAGRADTLLGLHAADEWQAGLLLGWLCAEKRYLRHTQAFRTFWLSDHV